MSPAWHSLDGDEVCIRLLTDAGAGLGEDEVRNRLAEHGPNRLYLERHEPFWAELLEELREPTVLLLLLTGVLYAAWGKLEDAITIFAVILLVAGVELLNEQRAKQAIRALQKLAEPTAIIRRSGTAMELAVEQIVPGDVVLLESGHRVPADGRLIRSFGLATDESALTGESVPVEKDAIVLLAPDTALADRRNLVFAGTLVTRGRGTAVVVATGKRTELGRIAGLAQSVNPPKTPLQRSMSELSNSLVWLALGVSVLVPALGVLLAHQPLNTMLLTGLSLAFATIPEEMPIIITSVLALGGYRLSKRHVIVKNLRAVETLGAVTVIATDKTGTLTENRMAVTEWWPPASADRLAIIGALCSGAATIVGAAATTGAGNHGANSGDPMEAALLRKAAEMGLNPAELAAGRVLLDEFTFDGDRKMMSVVFREGESLWIGAKGAPESILARSTAIAEDGRERAFTVDERQAVVASVTVMAARGLRVIALAEKRSPAARLSQEEAESRLAFAGLAGLSDPPRAEAAPAIAAAAGAGIRALMVTGDHPLTARSIADQVGLTGSDRVLTGADLDALSDEALQDALAIVSIFARTTSEHKLRIVRALQARGQRVAVTGDGINDAPALAAADIGIAMGETGSDVAREAGDMVLADDNFATIVNAIEEGRGLYANLRKTVRYYLTCKVALVASTLLPVLLLVPVPFAPVQIILMELFMDLAAGAAFIAEPQETDLLRQGPRDPHARFMERSMIAGIFSSAAGLFAAVSAAYLVTWYSTHDTSQAQGIAFFTWLIGHVLLAFNMRSERRPLLRGGLASNPVMLAWAAATAGFVLLAAYLPGLQAVFRATTPTLSQWAMMVGLAALGTCWMEGRKLLRSHRPL